LSGAATLNSEQKGEASNTPSSSSTPTPAAPEKVDTAPKPKLNITKASSPLATATPENPFNKVTVRPSNGSPAPTVRSSSESKLKRPRAESNEQNTSRTAPPTRKLATPSNDEDGDEYANRILGQIFRITLDPDHRIDTSNHKLIFLPNLRQELEEEGAPIRLSKDRLDSAILEAATTIPHNRSILDYLLPAWKRITKSLKGLRGYVNGKDVVLKEAKRLCMSHCIFAVEMPELYGSVLF